jgi:DNA-binding CsgD family transcriptional regulator
MIDLSSRQQQMLDLIARGYSNKEIARELNLGVGTVKVHVTVLFLKLGEHCRAGAVATMLGTLGWLREQHHMMILTQRLIAGLAGGVAFAATVAWVMHVHADPLPQPKPPGPGGSCPHGYYSSGSYCVPGRRAQDAVPLPRGGTCPFGWTSSGSYCVKSGR